MRLYELVAATKTHTPDQAAIKHGVSLKFINNQLNMGIRIEHEHTSDTSEATKIALDHLMEIPDYYTRLKKMETDAGVNESFDSEPADVVLLSRTSGLRRYSFDIDDNIYIIFMRGPDDGPSNGTTWEIEYGIKEPSDNKSGYIVKASPSQTGNASKVFSTLINFLRDFIYEQGVSRLVFTGSKSNGLSSLYDRMIPHLATRLGYTYERIQTIYSYQYVIDIPDETITEATPWLRQTPTMIRQATGLKGQVIVEMPADKFLSMTTSTPDERDYISKNAHSLRRYNKWAKMGNDEELSKKINTNNRKIWDQEDHDEDDYFRPEYGTIHMPWLNIQLSDDGSTGVITGHEGRHRASALIKVGNNKIQVVLIMRAGKDMLTGKYSKEYHLTSDHIPTMVKNQYNDAYYSTTDWQVKKDDMQQNSRR